MWQAQEPEIMKEVRIEHLSTIGPGGERPSFCNVCRSKYSFVAPLNDVNILTAFIARYQVDPRTHMGGFYH